MVVVIQLFPLQRVNEHHSISSSLLSLRRMSPLARSYLVNRASGAKWRFLLRLSSRSGGTPTPRLFDIKLQNDNANALVLFLLVLQQFDHNSNGY